MSEYILIGFVRAARLSKVKFKLLWTACFHVYVQAFVLAHFPPSAAVLASEVVAGAIHKLLTVKVHYCNM